MELEVIPPPPCDTLRRPSGDHLADREGCRTRPARPCTPGTSHTPRSPDDPDRSEGRDSSTRTWDDHPSQAEP